MKAPTTSMTPLSLIMLFLLCIIPQISVQAQTSGQNIFGGTSDDYSESIRQTNDGGYVITGRTTSHGAGSYDAYLTKADSAGNIQWTKTFGGTDWEYGYDVQQTPDSGYAILAATKSYGAGLSDVMLIRTDSVGTLVWTKTYGESSWDYGFAFKQTADSGFVVAGQTARSTTDIFVFKTDANGDTSWTKTFDGGSTDVAYDIVQTTDGGYIVTGITNSYGAGGYDAFLMKLTSTGTLSWMKTYGGAGREWSQSVLQTSDDGYIVVGSTNYISSGTNYDVYVIRTNSVGDTLWTKAFGGINEEYTYSIAQLANGGFLIAGRTLSFGAGGADAYLVNLDSNGNIQWSKTFGGLNDDEAFSVEQTTDGGCVIGGSTKSFGAGGKDIYFIKTDAYGNVSCDSESPSGTAMQWSNTTVTAQFPSVVGGASLASPTVTENAPSLTVTTDCAFQNIPSSEFAEIFQKTYGGVGTDYGHAVSQTMDGEYIVVGYTQNYGAGGDDVYVIQTDANGTVNWTKAFGGSSGDAAYAVDQCFDGGYVIAGETQSYGAGITDAYLIRTDQKGDTLWTKVYGHSNTDYARSVQQTTDGGFIMAGTRWGAQQGMLLIKTDGDGTLDWSRTYNGSGTDEANSVKQTSDGGYIVVGHSNAFGAGGKDILLIRTDLNGDTLWTKAYGGAGNEEGNDVWETADGGFIITGSTYSWGAGASDIYLLKVDAIGNLDWSQAYGESNIDEGTAVWQTDDGGYVVTAYTSRPSVGGEYQLLKTDNNGVILWNRTYGGSSIDYAHRGAQQTADGGFIMIGRTNSFGEGAEDVLLVKTDADGVGGACHNGSVSSTETTATTTVSGSSPTVVTTGITEGGTSTNVSSTGTRERDLNIATAITTADVSCNGGSDGSADLSVSGGSSPYTYSWSSGPSTQDVSGPAGTYYVTVTDFYDCTVTDSAIVNEPTLLTNTVSKTDVNCYGGNDGTASAVPVGGTPPYNYNWSNGLIDSTATNLLPGTYSVNVFDAVGCVANNIITITQPNALTGSLSGIDVTCFGGSTGAVDMTFSGGTSPYTFSWSNTATTEDITGLTAGVYLVTVTDSCGAVLIDSIVIDEPLPLLDSIASNNISCFGANDGTASVIASGGTPPYTYLWSTGPSTQGITGLAPATYRVTITDNCVIAIIDSVVISEPALLATSITGTNVNCNGGGDGTSTVIAGGGTAPYNYNWNNGQITSTAIALFPGSYGVNVFDDNACLASNNIVITEPAPLAISVTGTDANCNGGSTGSADLTVSDGTPPYTYQWNDLGASTTEDIAGLIAGTYSVSVTDSCGTVLSDSIIVNEPVPLSDTLIPTDMSCNGISDGSIDLAVSGGTTPYTFLWNDPGSSTTEDISGLDSGQYIVTITDACAFVIPDSTIIDEPAVLTTSIIKTDVSCNGAGDGTSTVTASGGTTPYNYLWNTGQTNSTAVALFPGSYGVNVFDANGCLASNNISISEPAVLSASITGTTNVLCNGGSTGSATVTPSGGTAPFTYLWDDPGAQTNATAANLIAGTYMVVVSDSCGGTYSQPVTISEPAALTGTLVGTDISCNGFNDGSIDAIVSSGSPPYTFLWSTGAITEDITGLSAGMYVLTITDSCNTTLMDSVEILEPSILTSTMTSTDISCFGMGDGTATAAPSGGIAPYLYTWNNGQFAATAVGLYAGNYSVNILDDNGCLTTNLVTINEPDALDLQVSIVDATCGNSDGSATAMVTGGTGAYTYSWSSGGSSSTESALPDGQYGVSVLDENGCSTSDSVSVITESLTQQICIVTVDSTSSRNIVVWENPQTPNIATYNIYREIPGTGYTLVGNMLWTETSEFTDTASGIDPTVTSYRYKISAVDTCGNESAMSDYHETMHLALPILSGGKVSLLWDNYEGFNFSYYRILRDSTGLGGNNWEAIDSVTNSNNTYTDNNPPTGTINYVVEVVATDTCTSDKTKNYNSSKSNTSSVGDPPDLLSATTSSTDVTFGMCDGTATVTATGGTLPLTYLWDGNANNQTTTTATNLCPGTYSVVVTDSLGNEVIVFASVGTLPGIGEGSEQNGIALYPNPNTGDFRVEWNKSTNIERLLIYNTLGQIVYYVDEELTLGAHNINLDGAAPGLYYLQIETGGKPLYQKVIIE